MLFQRGLSRAFSQIPKAEIRSSKSRKAGRMEKKSEKYRHLWSARTSFRFAGFRPSDFLSFPDPIHHGITIQVKPAAWTLIRRIPVLDPMERRDWTLKFEIDPFEPPYSSEEKPI